MSAAPTREARGSAGGSRHGSTRSTVSASASAPTASFFIIHEPDTFIRPTEGVITISQGTASSPSTRSTKNRKKPSSSDATLTHTSGSTRSAQSTANSTQQPSSPSAQRSNDEERDTTEAIQHPPTLTLTASAQENQGEPALSLLNRCGSAPDLPLHSSLSAAVYSSSKKRLQRIGAVNGAHQIALQRSRLTPLPIDIRTGTLKRSLQSDQPEFTAPMPRSVFDVGPTQQPAFRSPGRDDSLAVSALKEQIVDNEATIAGMKQRLAELERERTANVSVRHALDKQSQQLRQENQQLQSEKANLQRRVDDLTQQLMHCQHKLDKLTDRYATVYTGLQKLTGRRQASSLSSPEASVQTVVQALARENQDLQRKLRVLEARHVEDKALASNHEKKLKRLRAEMEAMQHIDDSNADNTLSTQSPPQDNVSSPASLVQSMISPPRSASRRVGSDAGTSVAVAADGTVGDARPAIQHRSSMPSSNTSHLVSAEDYQYIDPNILKVLDKVDSQFSIANAISLSATLKKWLNSCLHVVCSTHVPTVLQAMLKRACELLHCEHAAVFHVDHGARRVAALCSERGEEHWELPLDKGILGYAARQNVLCNVRRAYDDPRFYSSTDTITGLPSREVLCLPIVHELQPQYRSSSVFAVLQMWNTTHQKPFTPNDQILGSLLAIHVGAVVLQSKVGSLLLKANKKFHQIAQLPHEVAEYAQSLSPPLQPLSIASSHPSTGFIHVAMVDLVAAAEKKLAECLGIKHVHIFALDVELMKIWQVGRTTDSTTGCVSRVRKYANAASSLCALVLHSRDVLIVPEPASEPSFNDTVDMTGGAGGLYLAAVASPWSTQPLGMVQVARSAKAAFIPSSKSALTGKSGPKNPAELSEAGAAVAFALEREKEQDAEDALLMELIASFCRAFAGLLLHARAQQLHVDCPPEIQQAQLAFLSDHLSWLEGEQQHEQALIDEQVAEAERFVSETNFMEQRILDSIQWEKLGSSHSRQGTPMSTRPADASASQREAGPLERRNSSNDHVRAETPASASVSVTSSRRISSAGSPLRTRTPQRAPATLPSTSADGFTPSDSGDNRDHDAGGPTNDHNAHEGGDQQDETKGVPSGRRAGYSDDTSLEAASGFDGEFVWEDDVFPAAAAGFPPDVGHVVMESPEELDDNDDPTELTGMDTADNYAVAGDDADGGGSEITAPDDEDSVTRTGSMTASSGLISTDSAYSIDLG